MVACDLGDVAADVTAPIGSTLTALAAAHTTTVDPAPGNDVASVAVTVG
jgi:hypothetical protein